MLAGMHLLTPVLRHSAWGTTTDITGFLGMEPTGSPVAEAWWGAHEESPSIAHRETSQVALDQLIAREPQSCLGQRAHETWGPRLPFLLKMLAIAKPLSIQVHPKAEPAREGYERERTLQADAPRTFLDPFHKPEMVVAMTPMCLMAGIRPFADLKADLARLGTAGAMRLADAIGDNLDDYIRCALAGEGGADTLAALEKVGANAPAASALRVSAQTLTSFPGDAGALVALAMNVVELEPGQALFVPAGVLHSYQSGFGIEIMANSDNVVRAGLTPKHVDVPLLLSLATTEPSTPECPETVKNGEAMTFTTQAQEFALTMVSDGEAVIPSGPRIVLTTAGTAKVSAGAERAALASGQALFVRDTMGPATVSATGTAVVAHLPHEP